MIKKTQHVLSVAVMASFLFIAFGSNEEQQVEKKTETKIPAKASAIEIASSQLFADYEANAIAADEKYKNKVLLVTGKITAIDRDLLDDIYITLEGEESLGDVQCFFAEEHVKSALKLSKGQTITIKGLCDGKFLNVHLKACVIQE